MNTYIVFFSEQDRKVLLGILVKDLGSKMEVKTEKASYLIEKTQVLSTVVF